jgi:hypothetical protein
VGCEALSKLGVERNGNSIRHLRGAANPSSDQRQDNESEEATEAQTFNAHRPFENTGPPFR